MASAVLATPWVEDLEVNPLVVLGKGAGAVALDALITPSNGQLAGGYPGGSQTSTSSSNATRGSAMLRPAVSR